MEEKKQNVFGGRIVFRCYYIVVPALDFELAVVVFNAFFRFEKLFQNVINPSHGELMGAVKRMAIKIAQNAERHSFGVACNTTSRFRLCFNVIYCIVLYRLWIDCSELTRVNEYANCTKWQNLEQKSNRIRGKTRIQIYL